MLRKAYATDLTDVEWVLVEPYVRTSGYGRPPLHSKRELLNAIFYQLRAGSAWHLLPHDLPPWRTVYKQFEAWREDGTWDRLLHGLRRQVRQVSREPEPTAGAIDSQSVRTGSKRGAHGYDAGKQVAGRKRHIAVDTQGLPLAVLVQAASVQDPVGAAPVLVEAKANAPQLQLLWADARYQGPLVATAAAALGLRVEVVSKPPGTKGFVVLPRRWVVERSFGWLSKYRRVAGRDYETNSLVSEAIIKACFSHLMLRRLAKATALENSV
ncbi:MAG: IS5 family transposase [Janthinobacterium lividum]